MYFLHFMEENIGNKKDDLYSSKYYKIRINSRIVTIKNPRYGTGFRTTILLSKATIAEWYIG